MYTLRCLGCGWAGRTKILQYRQCRNCDGVARPINGGLYPIVKKLSEYGILVSNAGTVTELYDVVGTIEVIAVHVDFRQLYDTDLFKLTRLPKGFKHQTFCDDFGDERSRIVFTEHFFDSEDTLFTPKQRIRHAVRQLQEWADRMDENGEVAIYNLMGLI